MCRSFVLQLLTVLGLVLIQRRLGRFKSSRDSMRRISRILCFWLVNDIFPETRNKKDLFPEIHKLFAKNHSKIWTFSDSLYRWLMVLFKDVFSLQCFCWISPLWTRKVKSHSKSHYEFISFIIHRLIMANPVIKNLVLLIRRGGATVLWVVVSKIFDFHPDPCGNDPILIHIFQMGWNYSTVCGAERATFPRCSLRQNMVGATSTKSEI